MTQEEIKRYARHFVLPEFGREGQERLKQARVLVVGAGGLGSPLLLYLAAAGVGHLGIIDDDVVDISNLQRQVLYTEADIGKSKAETARERILALNPHLDVTVYRERLTVENVLQVIAPYDIVADGTDNFQTRYLVNDACVLAEKVNVYASIFRFEGQVSVFNLTRPDGSRGVNYRDLFPEPPDPGVVPNCAEGGVLGVLPGIIGSMQANEVIKVATGIGEPLAGRLFLFDAASFTTRVLNIPKNPGLVIKDLQAVQAYCELTEGAVAEINVDEYRDWLDKKRPHLLIDVREPDEYAAANMGGILIPLGEVLERAAEIPADRDVVIHCRSGKRSAQAIRSLQRAFGHQNLYNLQGGILAWQEKKV